MKKLISLLLALALVLSFSATAFASSLDAAGSSSQAQVKATYKAGYSGGTVYSVDVTWEGLSFTYNGAAQGTWDPETHTYTGTTEAGWDKGEGVITLTNHSNTAITATAAYAAADGYETVSMVFGSNGAVIASADKGDGTQGEAQTGTITVTPSGTLPDTADTETVIGTITITIQ